MNSHLAVSSRSEILPMRSSTRILYPQDRGVRPRCYGHEIRASIIYPEPRSCGDVSGMEDLAQLSTTPPVTPPSGHYEPFD